MSATTTVLVARSVVFESGHEVQDLIERHGGRLQGSGVGQLTASFSSADAAVHAAVSIEQHVHQRSGSRDGAQIGIDISDDAGAARTRADRLCRHAHAGEILVSTAVRAIASSGLDVDLVALDAPELDALRVLWQADTRAHGPRVVIADDAALIRAGLVRLLTDAGFDVVADVGDAVELVDAVVRERPDLVLTDVRMPPNGTDDGLRAALALRASHPATSVLVLSQHLAPAVAADLLDQRASGVGYLLKERVTEPEELLQACHHVLAGGRIVDPTVAERLMSSRRRGEALARLTDREREVLELMASGRSNAAIARSLHMSAKTVESHVRSIFMKLDLVDGPDEHRRVSAVVQWLSASD